jgi:hypothetical protein
MLDVFTLCISSSAFGFSILEPGSAEDVFWDTYPSTTFILCRGDWSLVSMVTTKTIPWTFMALSGNRVPCHSRKSLYRTSLHSKVFEKQIKFKEQRVWRTAFLRF